MLSIQATFDLVRFHLGDSPRAHHSVFVGFAMRHLAEFTTADPTLWEIVGLCHDIDFEQTRDDPSQHGLLAAQWLDAQLPTEALLAIRAHDRQTGVTSDTPIACALKLADALAVVQERLGDRSASLFAATDATSLLINAFADRPYLPVMIATGAQQLGISFAQLSTICVAAPSPHEPSDPCQPPAPMPYQVDV